jgi:hypothetical protein
MRNSRDGFLRQVHSQRNLNRYRFDTKAVHFVGKGFELDYIKRQIMESGSELARAIVAHERLGPSHLPD